MPPQARRRLSGSLLFSQALLAVALGASSHEVCAQSASNGAVLYAALQCGNCHGGGTIQTNAAHIQLGVDAANIKNATYGLVGINIGTQMSPYKGIADSNYNDLAAFIAQQVGGVVATCTSAGVPTASALATPMVCTNTGGSGTGGTSGAAPSTGGGCTLGRADASTDPLWLVMLGAAALVLRRRSRCQKLD
jgi:MYXO-CTERM domain-containing protein